MRLRTHYIYLCAAMLFWRNRSARIRYGKKATKLAQIAASPIQRREHEGKWTRFHLLPDLCPLCRSCCHEKSLTSVGSLLRTQLQSVSESVGSGLRTQFEWVKVSVNGWFFLSLHVIVHSLQFSSLTNEGGRLRRDVMLVRGKDFEIVPEPIWRALACWYGGAPALPRTVSTSILWPALVWY